jgi:hypothetical protein
MIIGISVFTGERIIPHHPDSEKFRRPREFK